jgi:hypothetical protein
LVGARFAGVFELGAGSLANVIPRVSRVARSAREFAPVIIHDEGRVAAHALLGACSEAGFAVDGAGCSRHSY